MSSAAGDASTAEGGADSKPLLASGAGDEKTEDDSQNGGSDLNQKKEDFGPCNACCGEGKPCYACGQGGKRCCYVMGCLCCCEEDSNKQMFTSIQKDGRFPTDVPCCIILIICLLIQFIIFITAVTGSADPARLTHYSDYEANVCKPGNEGGKYAAWPDIRLYEVCICLDDCDDTETDDRMVTPSWSTDLEKDYTTEEAQALGGYRSKKFLGYCIPDPNGTKEFVSAVLKEDYDDYSEKADDIGEALERGMAAVYKAWPVLLSSCFGALLLSFFYTKCLQQIADILVWVSIVLVFVGMLCLGIFLLRGSDKAYDFGYDKLGNTMYYGGIIFIILDIIYFFGVCFAVKRIILATAVAKEATRAMRDAWQLLFFPFIPAFVIILYLVYWLITAVNFLSVTHTVTRDWPSGVNTPYVDGGRTLNQTLDIGKNETYETKDVTDSYKYALAYDVFMLLWVTAFVGYASYMAITGVYAEWYFSDWADASEEHKKVGPAPTEFSPTAVTDWVKRVLRYHSGTIAVASFAVALIQYCDMVLTYVEKKLVGQDATTMQKILLAIIHCLLKCLQCLMDRINKHGIIITAVYGWPFCAASAKGIELVFKNVVRSSALDMVSGYLINIGQATICAFNGAITAAICRAVYDDDKSSIWAIVVAVMLITYMVSSPYLSLFEVAVDTVFICFLIDEEHNSGGNMRASSRLKRIINEDVQPSEKEVKDKEDTKRSKGLFGRLGKKDEDAGSGDASGDADTTTDV